MVFPPDGSFGILKWSEYIHIYIYIYTYMPVHPILLGRTTQVFACFGFCFWLGSHGVVVLCSFFAFFLVLPLLVFLRGGAFAEWDFLRGIREGWIPRLPNPNVASVDMYGTCYDIYNRTSDNYQFIVDEYPDPRTLDWNQWQGWDVDDDFVLNDGPVRSRGGGYHPTTSAAYTWIASAVGLLILSALWTIRHQSWKRRQAGYEPLK